MTDTPAEREAESTWTTLRRRKVVQWGVVYVAAAWGFLQGLEYLSGTYDWPRQIQQLTTLALLIGLPVVLVLAWYHGDRGQQRITTPEFAILTLLLLLGGGAFWYYDRASETATVATPPSATAVAIATDRSIAVLPFVNMSADKEQEYFADGISEELLNLLAQVPELRVIARTSSFSFKGANVDIAEIARRLNVANVLEGSVRKSGDTLRITAQLVRASDSSHLWSQTYDRQLTDVFKIQDEIAAAVVDELKIELLGGAPRTRATDSRAYALFLQAREISWRYTGEALEQSNALHQQALTRDPAYSPAWLGLAENYCDQVFNLWKTADEGLRLAREATDKALAIDKSSATAYARLGLIAMYRLELAESARHLEHALALEPTNLDSIGTAASLARRLGRSDQAVELMEYQVRLDPLNTHGHDNLAYAYRYTGRLDDAIASLRTALRLSPDYFMAHEGIGELMLQQGRPEAALAEMQLESTEAARLVGLSMAYSALGRKEESDATVEELIAKYQNWAFNIAYVLAFRSEADRAFEWLDKAVHYQDPYLGAVAFFPMFANLHDDPRWLPFLRKLGVAPEQLAAIKFDVKVPK